MASPSVQGLKDSAKKAKTQAAGTPAQAPVAPLPAGAYTAENFPYDKYLATAQNKNDLYPDPETGVVGPNDKKRIYEDYLAKGASWKDAPAAPPVTAGTATSIVAGNATTAGQMNVADYAGQVAKDPSIAIPKDDPATPQNESGSLVNQAAGSKVTGTEAGTNVNGADPKYNVDADALKQTAAQGQAQTAAQVDPRTANTYDAAKTAQDVANADMTGQQGQVSQNAQVTAPQIDIGKIAAGTDANGVGKALADYAVQDLADVDKKATVKGQLDLLQGDFVGPNGEPKIPGWAQGTAKAVGRITAFTGSSGSAATAAMAAALMEASLPIASQDAQFFQTLTVKNLDNKQASIINKANVLAKMETDNADARLTAAVENSKAFLAMDMKNLDNKQQAAVINNQNRVQSILEDAKAENAKRLFTADSQNNMDMYYDNLNASINMYNTSQANQMEQFNTGQTNDMSKFNSDMENNREQFYKNMQFNIDTANAKWRQTVTLQEDTQAFEAAATDVKNLIGISTEQLNQLWDRSDALLDYAWKSSEAVADRNAAIALKKLEGSIAGKAADAKGTGELLGTVGAAIVGKIFG